jgi:glycerophosphoryl diester phosphodiesterase
VNITLPEPYGSTYTNDYFIHDFTLAEIKLLKRKQRLPYRNQMLNEMFPYMTFNETVQLMQSMADKKQKNRSNPYPTGLYIETK